MGKPAQQSSRYVEGRILVSIGDLVEDIVVWHSSLRHGTDNAATVHRSRGGSAANVAARAAAQIRTRFIGCVGADRAGELLVSDLQGCGVEVSVQRRGASGCIVVLVDATGERTMFPDRGASALLEPIDPGWLEDAGCLHVPSYCFAVEPTASSVRSAIERAHRDGVEVSVDASSVDMIAAYGVSRYLALLAELRPTILLANADEARLLGVDAAAAPLADIVVVKNGPAPTVLHRAGQEPLSIPVPAVAVVRDTTGAGDAFAAGFLAARLNGRDPVAGVQAGHSCARDVLATPGSGTVELSSRANDDYNDNASGGESGMMAG